MERLDDCKYWAFISYSHQDSMWAGWLHRALETYRVPPRLVGRVGPAGTLPRRLYPVFRDRDELPSAAELSEVINEALRASRYLIVVCSPRSAASRWVEEEVRYFKSLGRNDRVLCLIVDGEPGDPACDCFVPSLRRRHPGGEPVEPIAADARPAGDGREIARLKLIAGLLGVGYDELRQRERQRRWQQRLWGALLVASVFGALATVWQVQVEARRQALQDQASLERRARLYASGKAELAQGSAARAALLFAEVLRLGRDDAALRYLLAQAMTPVEALLRAWPAHDQEVSFLSLADEGRELLSGGFDRCLQVRSTTDGRSLHRFEGHPARVFEASRCANGRRYLSWGPAVDEYLASTATVLLWAAGRSAPLARYEGFGAGELGRPFDADCRHAVVVDARQNARLYDATSGLGLGTIGTAGAVQVASYDAAGSRLYSGGVDGVIDVWSADGRRRLHRFQAHAAAVERLLFTADGRRLVSVGRDRSFRVWDLARGVATVSAASRRPIRNLQLSADGRRLLVTSYGELAVWGLDTGELLFFRPLGQYFKRLFATLSPDGRQLLLFEGGRPVVWDVDAGYPLYALDGHFGNAGAGVFAPDGLSLFTGGADGRLLRWQHGLRPRQQFRHPIIQSDVNNTGCWFADHHPTRPDQLLTSCSDGLVRLWNPITGGELRRYAGHQGIVKTARFSADGRWIATASNDLSSRVWDAETGVEHLRIETGGRPRDAEFSSDGKRLLVSYYDGAAVQEWDLAQRAAVWQQTAPEKAMVVGRYDRRSGRRILTDSLGGIQVWDAGARQPLFESRAHRSSSAFFSRVTAALPMPDADRLLSAGFDRSLRLWDLRSGEALQRAEAAAPVVGMVLSPDLGRAAAFTLDGTISLWQLADNRVQSLKGHNSLVAGAAFSPDGDLLLSGGEDGLVLAWDARSGERLFTVGQQPGGVAYRSLFSRDGRWFPTPGHDDSVRLWELSRDQRDPAELAAILRCRVPWRLDDETLVQTPIPADCPAAPGESNPPR